MRRPVATTLLVLAIGVLGFLGYRALPVAALPAIDFPVIEVSGAFPGATAETMSESVTTPLETSLANIPGLESLTSVSTAGSTSIALRFNLDKDIDDAAQDVQAAISAASGDLPRDLPQPPVYRKVNPADPPIMTLALVSRTLPPYQTSRYAETILLPRLSQIDGVGQVRMIGAHSRAIRIALDANATDALDLGIEQVRSQLTQASVNGPKGRLDGRRQAYAISANDQLLRAPDYEALAIKRPNGALVHLRDIGTAAERTENELVAAWTDGQPAILLEIHRRPGANTVETADRVRQRLPALTAALPATAELRLLSDTSVAIEAAVDHTTIALILSVVLVTAILWLFLRQSSVVLIAAIVVPLSLLGTLAVMAWAGLSLNTLTLIALAIAAGFVVDDAIVMVENIARHLERGSSPFEAAVKGSRQITFTIISLTASLIAVFIPLIWMEGTLGRLLREFGLTMSVAIAISAILSLTLTPAMCAWLLRGGGQERDFLRPLLQLYSRLLQGSIAKPRRTLLSLGLLALLTGLLAVVMPKGYIPDQAADRIEAVTEMAGGTSFAASSLRHKALAARLARDPAVDGIDYSVGETSRGQASNVGQMTIRLRPSASSEPPAKILSRLRAIAAQEPGIALFLHPLRSLQLQDRVSRARHQYVLQAPGDEAVRDAGMRLAKALETRPELIDVAWDGQEGGRGVDILVDRDRALLMGVTMADVGETLYSAFGQRQIAKIYTPEGQYPAVLELAPGARRDPQGLAELRVGGSQGLVPLAAFANWREVSVPLSIVRFGRFPAVAVSFDQAPGSSLEDAIDAVEDEVAKLKLPEQVSGRFTGEAESFRGSLAGQTSLAIAVVLVMYIVLGVLYESFIHPLTILSTLPAAVAGGLAALAITGHEFDVAALLGILLLVGIVKKNAILMIDFALDAARRTGAGPVEAIVEACQARFRPILMTTAAALVGALPLILDDGPGAELRRPIGIAIIGGLVVAQLLTLFSTPVLYVLFTRIGERAGSKASSLAEAAGTRPGDA